MLTLLTTNYQTISFVFDEYHAIRNSAHLQLIIAGSSWFTYLSVIGLPDLILDSYIMPHTFRGFTGIQGARKYGLWT